MKICVVLWFVLISAITVGQGHSSYWYFRTEAGVRFTNYQPSAILDNDLLTAQGCASLSTIFGELDYYASPIAMNHSLHDSVANSDGLIGTLGSYQGVYLVPHPILPSRTFHISNSINLGYGHVYSTIRKTLDKPLGEIQSGEKNVVVSDSTGEKNTVVHHANGRNYWLISRKPFEDTLYAFLINENGIGSQGVASYAPLPNYFEEAQLKASPNGKYVGEACGSSTSSGVGLAMIYLFNNVDGTFNSPIQITDSSNSFYSLEFSSNSRYLYLAGQNNEVLQYDLSVYETAAVNNSQQAISAPNAAILQMAIDRCIYAIRFGGTHMHRLCNVNGTANNVNYEEDAVSLGGQTSHLYLPSFVQSNFHPAYFDYSVPCQGREVNFFIRTNLIDSVLWNFGDSASGSQNTSSDLNPTHLFSDSDSFNVTATVYFGNEIDTFSRELIFIKGPSSLDIEPIYSICTGDSVSLNIDQENQWLSYQWSTGEQSSQLTILDSGIYWATAYNDCDTVFSNFLIMTSEPLNFELNDTTICEGESLLVSPQLGIFSSKIWSTGDTSDFIVVDTSDSPELSPVKIWLSATNPCGTASDTMTINFLPIPTAELPDDSIHCSNQAFYISHHNQSSINYIWSDSSSDYLFRVDTTSSVWLLAENQCGFFRDTFNVQFYPEIKTYLGEDTIICSGDSILLNAASENATYNWNTGSTDSSIFAYTSKTYIVTITSDPCRKVVSRKVDITPEQCDSVDCKFSIPNIFTPNADGINDLLTITNGCYDLYFNVSIYNRWGQLVFQGNSTLSKTSWDGSINGEKASAGTYFVVAQLNNGKSFCSAVALVR